MLASYQSVATHGGVAAADPHRLILMLIDGALERVAQAIGCMRRGATSESSTLLHRAVSIIDELRNSLDMPSGGALAQNLESLYEYMCRQLMRASLERRVELLDEVMRLLNEIRSAWIALPAAARRLRPALP